MNWVERSLDELGEVSRGRSRHRPRDAAHLYGGTYPFVQTGDVKSADLYLTEFTQTYSDAGLAQSKLWKAGTLCITIAANIADTAILGIDACFPDSVIGFIANENKADPRFIKYMFDARLKHRYRTFSQGVAQDNLSQEKLLSIRFQVPERVSDQKAIADVLSRYDASIANNKRRIDLLEKSARLLFEEWFLRLRYPGHEHEKVVDGVPQGWEQRKLGEVFPLSYGKALPEAKRSPGDFLVYGSSGEVGTHREKLVTGPGIVVGRKGNVGSVYWVDCDFWPIDTVYFVQPECVSLFGYHMLSLQSFENSDAAVPGLNRDYAHGKKLKWPPMRLRNSFEQFAGPIFLQRAKLIQMNARLRAGRDLLLPRLMDGRIEV